MPPKYFCNGLIKGNPDDLVIDLYEDEEMIETSVEKDLKWAAIVTAWLWNVWQKLKATSTQRNLI